MDEALYNAETNDHIYNFGHDYDKNIEIYPKEILSQRYCKIFSEPRILLLSSSKTFDAITNPRTELPIKK